MAGAPALPVNMPSAAVPTVPPAPPVVTPGAAAGTGATASVVGTDLAGTVSFTQGTSPSNGTKFIVTFGGSYTAAPVSIQITEYDTYPEDSTVLNAIPFVSAYSNEGFTVNIPAAGSANQSFSYSYTVSWGT